MTVGKVLLSGVAVMPSVVGTDFQRDKALQVLEQALQALDSLQAYRCRIRSMVRSPDKRRTDHKVMEYTWIAPGHIHIRLLQGGIGEIYMAPGASKVRARVPGIFSFLKISLDLRDPRLTDLRGLHVSESSWLTMVRTWVIRAKNAPRVAVYRSGDTLAVETSGMEKDPFGEYRAILYLDGKTFLPVGGRAWDREGDLVREAWFERVEVNPPVRPKDIRF